MTEKQRNIAEWVAIAVTLLFAIFTLVSSAAVTDYKTGENFRLISENKEDIKCVEEKVDTKMDEVSKQITQILIILERLETKIEGLEENENQIKK